MLFSGINSLTKENLATKMFGKCIQASFKEPHYTLTLSNLSFTDTIVLSLIVVQEIQDTLTLRPIVNKSVDIIEVRGM